MLTPGLRKTPPLNPCATPLSPPLPLPCPRPPSSGPVPSMACGTATTSRFSPAINPLITLTVSLPAVTLSAYAGTGAGLTADFRQLVAARAGVPSVENVRVWSVTAGAAGSGVTIVSQVRRGHAPCTRHTWSGAMTSCRRHPNRNPSRNLLAAAVCVCVCVSAGVVRGRLGRPGQRLPVAQRPRVLRLQAPEPAAAAPRRRHQLPRPPHGQRNGERRQAGLAGRF